MVGTNPDERAKLVVQIRTYGVHLLSADCIPLPETGETGNEGTRDLVKSMIVMRSNKVDDNAEQYHNKRICSGG